MVLCYCLFFGMNVAQRHGRFLVAASYCYSQGDGVNKAPSATCGNFAIDTVCGYLIVLEKPGPDRSEEAGDTELRAMENM